MLQYATAICASVQSNCMAGISAIYKKMITHASQEGPWKSLMAIGHSILGNAFEAAQVKASAYQSPAPCGDRLSLPLADTQSAYLRAVGA